MRIGVVPNLDRGGGGIYQYAVTLVSVMPEVLTSRDDLTVFLYGGESLPPDLANAGYRCVEMRSARGFLGGVWYRLSSALPSAAVRKIRRALGRKDDPSAIGAMQESASPASLVDPGWRVFFEREGIDLLVFTTDVDFAYRTGVPFVVAVHDIQHRLQPEFPEVSADGEWERREFRIGHCVRGAAGVLVDSEVGKEDIIEAYGIAENAVSIVPFVPANYLQQEVSAGQIARVRERYQLPQKFLFYPAAFWPHKNHLRMVEAIAELRRIGVDAPLVLSGPSGGPQLRRETFAEVIAAAATLGVGDLVTYLGYVEDDAMSALYAGATALVMPTFFGPTNIPVVEAFRYGCPVITSDIRGIREQVGDAALLVDPRSVSAIAAGMRSVLEDTDLVERLRLAGYRHLRTYSLEDYKRCVADALARAMARIGQGD